MEYVLKRSKRCSVQIQIDYDGAVIVKAPLNYATRKIDEFVTQKQSWINKSQTKILANNIISPGYVHIQGKKFKILFNKGLRNFVSFHDNHITVETTIGTKQSEFLHRYFRQEACLFLENCFTELLQSVKRYDLHTERPVQIKKFKRKWGCCSFAGTITLNYKLYHAPCNVINSVIFHELCHLKYFNHSKEFYQLLEKIDPKYAQHSITLKQYAGYLLQ